MTEDQRTILRKAIVQFELGETMVFYREIGEQIAAALRALLDENADLKERIDKAYEDIALDQRTNETLRAEVAALKAGREVPTSITRCMVRLDGVWITPDAALDEIHRLRADLAALKANDPLAEMWAALTEYQPQADRDGHGESWRVMCEQRTVEAASASSWAASDSAASAASWAASAAARAAAARAAATQSIAAIRKAKEAKP